MKQDSSNNEKLVPTVPPEPTCDGKVITDPSLSGDASDPLVFEAKKAFVEAYHELNAAVHSAKVLRSQGVCGSEELVRVNARLELALGAVAHLEKRYEGIGLYPEATFEDGLISDLAFSYPKSTQQRQSHCQMSFIANVRVPV